LNLFLDAKEGDVVNMSTGLSLLMSYDSSSEDSQPCSPGKPAFDFNLGLLALVASNEHEKRTEVLNTDQQVKENVERQTERKQEDCFEFEKQQGKDEDDFEVKKKLEEEKLMNWFKSVGEEQIKAEVKEEHEGCKEKSSVGESTCVAITMETDVLRNQPTLDDPIITEEYAAPHSLLCNGRLLRLHEPHHPGNQDAFAKRWIEGKVRLLTIVKIDMCVLQRQHR
jgi:hypothetical protein